MDLWTVIGMILCERERSIKLHGDWSDYTTEQMMSQIIHELMVEAGEAEANGDITGQHGLINELVQVASCCIKAIMIEATRSGFVAGKGQPLSMYLRSRNPVALTDANPPFIDDGAL